MDITITAFDKYKKYKEIAGWIKKEMDKKHTNGHKATEGVFHCIVGKSFAGKRLNTYKDKIDIY